MKTTCGLPNIQIEGCSPFVFTKSRNLISRDS